MIHRILAIVLPAVEICSGLEVKVVQGEEIENQDKDDKHTAPEYPSIEAITVLCHIEPSQESSPCFLGFILLR